MPIHTNLIGIAGPPGEPYIEIIYSAADPDNPGYNVTRRRMVSPPHIFRNGRVYMTYRYAETNVGSVFSYGPSSYTKTLLRDFEKGGAEYFRIINHSPDKHIEFFFAGAETLLENRYPLPSIWHRRAPVYFLLYPDRKPPHNVNFHGTFFRFEGSYIGELTVTEPWSIDKVMALYRAEHDRSCEVELMVGGSGRRVKDAVELLGQIFYGSIGPGEELHGNEHIWLLATPNWMFVDRFEFGRLR